ncbi:MAG: DinB family protein [Planctomycetota bacterium]|jgi:uncharacterized damage-inducible protein DinB
MRALDVFLRQFDHAWHHEWESLCPLLDNVSEDEAAWQASAYRGIEREEGWPPPGSIHWHVAHLADCKRGYTAILLDAEDRPGTPAASFAESFRDLQEAHAAQREAICSIKEEDLDRPLRNGVSIAEFLTSTIRHDTWHAGQVAAARRLYAVAGAGDNATP